MIFVRFTAAERQGFKDCGHPMTALTEFSLDLAALCGVLAGAVIAIAPLLIFLWVIGAIKL
jgi:hypothetical protein